MIFNSVQFSAVAQSCPTLCDPMNRSTPDLPVHHQLNEHEFQQALGDGEGQGRLACCSPWGCKESDMTVQMNNNVLSNVGNKVWKIQSSEDLGFMDEHHTPWCGVLRFMGSQRVGHDWATELNWTEPYPHQIMESNQHFENIQKWQMYSLFSKTHVKIYQS